MKYTSYNTKAKRLLNSYMFQILIIYSVICVLPFFREFFSITITGRIHSIVAFIILGIFFSKYGKTLNKQSWIYIISLLIIAIVHLNLSSVDNPIKNSLIWINLIVILSLSKRFQLNSKLIIYFVLSFYITECSICIIERLGHFYFIDYSSAETMSATQLDADLYDSTGFRSRGLLLHPLYNANVISIYMGFILTSQYLKKNIKFTLLIIGAIGIWACNSRACMAIWIIIFTYRLFFYKKNIVAIGITLLILYLLFPTIIEFIQKTGILGRFNFDFSDSSVNSRLLAYPIFLSYPWTTNSIIFGLGDWIYYPTTEVSLENGFLLNWAYWGWIVGSIKSVFEISLTYQCLKGYYFKEKLIIMLSFWGVASMNNNMINILFISMFTIVNIALNNRNYPVNAKTNKLNTI